MFRPFRHGVFVIIGLASGVLALRTVKGAEVLQPGNLRAAGKVDFAVSCVPAVQSEFERGVALLHSFFYEEARRVFTSVSERDTKCAMAQWGIAMTWWHPIWTPPTPGEMSAGKAAIEKAMALNAGTDRERGFITALNVGYATPGDTSLSKQLEAAAILEELWQQNAKHPGVVHYLIHCYDYPALAKRGLPAARSYGSVAPWVPHALHMPSHIFTRLGMWDESILANQASAEASRAYAAMRHRAATEAEELHALDYMVYSYLQEARDIEAKQIVDLAAKVRKTNPELEFSAAYALAAIPTRYAFERNDWATAAGLPVPDLPHWSSFPFMEALIEYGHALGRAHIGKLDGARKAIARMRQLRDATKDPKFDYFKSHLDLQMQAASAWVAAGEGKKNEATEMLRRAADAEDILGKHPVSPGAFVPIREQLGDLLLEVGQAKQAQQEFEAALKIYPGRFRALYGAARAAEQTGDKEAASRYYAKLSAQTAKASGFREELNRIRQFRATQFKAAAAPNEVAEVRQEK